MFCFLFCFFFVLFLPVDGNYTEWTAWTVCDRTCGTGLMTRWRACSNPAPQYGGRDCSLFGSDTETKSCVMKDYCPSKLGKLNVYPVEVWWSVNSCVDVLGHRPARGDLLGDGVSDQKATVKFWVCSLGMH